MRQQRSLRLGTGAITKEAYGTGYHKGAFMGESSFLLKETRQRTCRMM
jgi:hypothetical protein